MPAENENLDVKETSNKGPSPDTLESSSDSESNQEVDANKGQSMADFVKATLQQKEQTGDKESTEKPESEVVDSDEVEQKKETDKTAESESKEKEELDSESESDSKEEAEEKDSKETEAEESEEKDKESEEQPVPYARFKEVNDKAKAFEAEVQASKAEVEDYRKIIGFLRQNGISQDLFTKTMFFLADYQAGNIEKVAPQIREWHESMLTVTGEKLPADLQRAVDSGDMDIEIAKRIAKAEAKANMVEKQGRKTIEQIQEDQRKQAEGQLREAADRWEATKQTNDPDYRPKAKESDDDGKWEFVKAKYLEMLNATNAQGEYLNPVKSAKDMTDLMDRAYQTVDRTWKKLSAKGKPMTRKVLSSNGSSGNKKQEVNAQTSTLGDFVKEKMKERGHVFTS